VLEVTSLVKTFPAGRGEERRRVHAVEDVNLRVEERELVTLLGPSGCGKTTTLRCIAGLEMPDGGEIVVGDRIFFSSARKLRVPANERGLGMVFQSYAIWPHMNVFQNAAFPLQVLPRRKRPSRKEIRERVERVLEVVRLGELSSRQATDLSGGQQQRLALARALVLEPPLLLLDEPLSNLDAKLREEMVFELKRLQRELGVTTVYVTHDQQEALAMSNRVAVMSEGRIRQIGRPRDVYEKPASRFVADFIGTSNFIDARIAEKSSGGYDVETPAGRVTVPAVGDFAVGDAVILCARPEHVELSVSTNGAGPAGTWSGRVENRAFIGEAVDHVVTVGDRTIRVRCNPAVSIPAGTDVSVLVRGEACSLLPAE
jgi:iron(III) transport system ATP-binding protein